MGIIVLLGIAFKACEVAVCYTLYKLSDEE
jgi:hypothetical protein